MDADRAIEARSLALECPVMAVSSTPNEMPAHWLISTGQACLAMPRRVAPKDIGTAFAGVIG
ncbi:hypothetical protein D3C73_1052330 [compost metagenome]